MGRRLSEWLCEKHANANASADDPSRTGSRLTGYRLDGRIFQPCYCASECPDLESSVAGCAIGYFGFIKIPARFGTMSPGQMVGYIFANIEIPHLRFKTMPPGMARRYPGIGDAHRLSSNPPTDPLCACAGALTKPIGDQIRKECAIARKCLNVVKKAFGDDRGMQRDCARRVLIFQ